MMWNPYLRGVFLVLEKIQVLHVTKNFSLQGKASKEMILYRWSLISIFSCNKLAISCFPWS